MKRTISILGVIFVSSFFYMGTVSAAGKIHSVINDNACKKAIQGSEAAKDKKVLDLNTIYSACSTDQDEKARDNCKNAISNYYIAKNFVIVAKEAQTAAFHDPSDRKNNQDKEKDLSNSIKNAENQQEKAWNTAIQICSIGKIGQLTD